MADEKKSLELFSNYLEDRQSLKSSEDMESRAIEAGLEIHELSHDASFSPERPEAHNSDLERGVGADGDAENDRPDANIVEWDGDKDPENPMNFSLATKIWMSSMASFMTFGVSFASSVFSADTRVTAKKFNVSEEVMVLGVSLYVLGFACGR